MEPTRVRTRILEEHDRLRARLAELELAAMLALTDRSLPLTTLVADTRCLLEDFIEHTRLEDDLLAPALLDADAWGPMRASQLRESHVDQRRELHELLEMFGAGIAAKDSTARTLRWIARVRLDMQDEERTVLNRGLLRDDVVAVAMEAG
jgi:hypothetical protein